MEKSQGCEKESPGAEEGIAVSLNSKEDPTERCYLNKDLKWVSKQAIWICLGGAFQPEGRAHVHMLGTGMGMCLACLKNDKEVSVAGAE